MDKLLSLGIDPWSMLLYLINTGIVLAVLTYFFYKPMLQFVDKRRQQISDSIEEAENLQKSFEKKLKKSEQERKEMEAQLKDEINKLNKFVDEKKAKMIAEMEEMRSQMMQKAQKEIDDKKAALIKDAEKEVMALMAKIVLQIVENKVPENVIQESIESAWKQYSK